MSILNISNFKLKFKISYISHFEFQFRATNINYLLIFIAGTTKKFMCPRIGELLEICDEMDAAVAEAKSQKTSESDVCVI